MVRVLANPVLLRAMIVLVCAASAFLLGLLSIRLLRSKLSGDELADAKSRTTETLPLHVYNTVIQQLKQQKHELMVQSQAEQQRARASENFNHAVLANLSSGVLVFGANGLVKSSNPAAKTILGFASATGMSAEGMFRGAKVRSASRLGNLESTSVADEIQAVLREGSKRREVETEYETPAGERRFLGVTVSPVPASDGSLMGVACVINDRTQLELIRQQQEVQGEISTEMALQLRKSLTAISGYAQQLGQQPTARLAEQLAKDIALEAAQLDRSLGAFLKTKPPEKAVAHSAGS